jgi:5-methylthioribose kinase
MKEWITFRGRFETDPKNYKIYQDVFAIRQSILGSSVKDTFAGLEKIRKILGQ